MGCGEAGKPGWLKGKSNREAGSGLAYNLELAH